MATLSLASGTASHDVSTVRGGGATSASGTVAFRKVGAGGAFTLNLKTSAGATVAGTIDCSAFAQHAAEGG